MAYKVQSGDSPARIARRFGVPMGSLIAANPHKATHVVAGQRTWQALGLGEPLNVPVGVGAIAPAAAGAPHGQIKQGSSGPDVALWQTIIGVTADGIFGPKTATATKAWQGAHGLAADGIVGPKTWGAALGGIASAIPVVSPVSMPSIPGLPSSLPSIPLPVSFPTITPTGVVPAPAPAAVQALASVDPCYSGNVMMVCAAQAALGVAVDGKYGNDTANALRRYVPNAPAGCSPRPSWWTSVGGNNCGGGGAAPSLPIPMPSMPIPAVIPAAPWVDPGFVPSGVIPMAPAPAVMPTQAASSPVGPAQPLVANPEKKGISTGAMVAGALGVAALVGVVAVAATGKKGTRGSRGARGPARRSKKRRK